MSGRGGARRSGVRAAARAAAVASLACLCAACPKKTAVWIAPESTAQHVVFRIAEERGGERATWVSGIRVDRCDHEPTGVGALWNTGPVRDVPPARDVVYGVTPPGWETSEGPAPLGVGCYQVGTGGTGRTSFDVTADGRVVEHAVPPGGP